MSRLGSKPAKNPKVEWIENEAMPRVTTLSASAASNATAFGVTDNIFRVNDVIRFTSQGFAAYVTATASGAITATVIATASHAQASAANASEIYLVSNSNAEGATLREIKYPQLVTASNYAQIIRTPTGITETEQATEHYGGEERARLQREAGIEHSRAWEQTYFFGARDLVNTNQRSCAGLYEFIATNVTADTGGLTESDFTTFLRSGFRYGSDRKVLFASPKAAVAIDAFTRASSGSSMYNTTPQNMYGVNVKTYVSSQGTVDIVLKRDWNDSANYAGYAFLVDMDAIKMRPLRDTRLKQNVQAPDYDGFKDEYITEVSLQVTHERRHALLTGVT